MRGQRKPLNRSMTSETSKTIISRYLARASISPISPEAVQQLEWFQLNLSLPTISPGLSPTAKTALGDLYSAVAVSTVGTPHPTPTRMVPLAAFVASLSATKSDRSTVRSVWAVQKDDVPAFLRAFHSPAILAWMAARDAAVGSPERVTRSVALMIVATRLRIARWREWPRSALTFPIDNAPESLAGPNLIKRQSLQRILRPAPGLKRPLIGNRTA